MRTLSFLSSRQSSYSHGVSSAVPKPSLARAGLIAACLGVGAVTFAVRLFTVLRSAGLYGYGNYDDGVYFAASIALVHGRLPYRDFLLLHPPGIALALSPFAGLAGLIGEPDAFAVARLCWMGLGAVSAALVVTILWPRTRFGAIAGGGFYAFFYPAVFVERLTVLEAPQTLALLLALLVLTRATAGTARSDRSWRRPWPWLGAGLLLGLLPDLKIWGVLIVVIVLGWVGVSSGWRRTVQTVVGVAVSGLGAYLPFFLHGPAPMWRMLVLDQLGRADASFGPATRLMAVAGLQRYDAFHPTPAPLIVAVVGLVAVIALGLTVPWARIFVVLLAGGTALLVSTPAWFQHYAALVSAPLALLVGAVVGELTSRLWRWRPVRWVVPALFVVVLVGYAVPLGSLHLNARFPQAALAVAARTDGCVTSDDPTNLIELDVLGRNLDRGCPVVIDLGGYAYDLKVDGREIGRKANPAWQREALTYLGSGSITVLSRLNTPQYNAFTPASKRIIASWTELTHVGRTVVRTPETDSGS